MNGWAGRILHVDLSTGQTHIESLDPALARAYLGGRGLGARIVFDRVPPSADPLGEENILAFCAGPLTGVQVPMAGRFSLSTKSPLTGTIFDSNSGGQWGVRLKWAQWDALVVSGRAASPVWIELDENGATLHDAAALWGLDVPMTSQQLKAPSASVMCIGPAGEHLVKLAAIMNDETRALGRGGVGAVMGSKKLKAIVARGTWRPTVADAEALKFFVYESEKLLKANPITSQGLEEFGTAALVNLMNAFGVLPTRNFQAGHFENADAISGEAIAEQLLVKRAACWSCPIGCTRVTHTKDEEGEGPEYETIYAFGSVCGVDDLSAVTEANYLCNRLGLDTISTGVTIACAMELSERGVLTKGPRFGDASALKPLVADIAYRRGLGDELAQGSKRFAASHAAPEYAMQVKGLEIPAYDPRGMQGQGLLFATSNRGACHLRGNMLGPEILGLPKRLDRFETSGKAGILIVHQHMSAVFDSLVNCKFAGFAIADEYFARMLSAATGTKVEAQELLLVGERIWNLERLYNLRAGFTRGDDTLPPRLLKEPIQAASPDDHVVQLEPMLQEYYRFRGWTPEGVPSQKKLKQLGLLAEVEADVHSG